MAFNICYILFQVESFTFQNLFKFVNENAFHSPPAWGFYSLLEAETDPTDSDSTSKTQESKIIE